MDHWFPVDVKGVRAQVTCADGGYTGELLTQREQLRQRRRLRLEIVKRNDTTTGFVVLRVDRLSSAGLHGSASIVV